MSHFLFENVKLGSKISQRYLEKAGCAVDLFLFAEESGRRDIGEWLGVGSEVGRMRGSTLFMERGVVDEIDYHAVIRTNYYCILGNVSYIAVL